MAHIGNCVLDIPVPKSVMSILTVPPVCLSKIEDLHILDLIKDFGQEFDCCQDEVRQAVHLASGPSDVMIILERPSCSHEYTLTTEEIVRQSPTLNAVDELIKFSTKGTRSIYTVSVLDAFMLKPNNRPMIPDQRCHQLLAQIIRLKRPKVLLVCHTQSYSDPWMQELQLPCNGDYKMGHKTIRIGNETEINVVQSFHPSIAVNHMPRSPQYRALLLHHFVAAFSLLHGQYTEPNVVEAIRGICAEKGRYQTSSIEIPAYRISEALDPRRALTSRMRIRPKGENERDKTLREKNLFDDMYRRLLQLSESPQPIGALSISRVVIYLWKEHFCQHPLYSQVMTMLIYRGNKQECWLPSKTHTSDAEPIEIQFPRMNSKDKQTSANAFDQSITKRESAAIFGASNTHVHDPEERQMLKKKLQETADLTLLQKLIGYVKEDCRIEEQLINSSIYSLGPSLRICRLVSQIRFQIEILRMDDYVLKDIDDFIDTSDRLEQLIMHVQDKLL